MKRKSHRISPLPPGEKDPDIKWIDDYDIINRFHISKSTLDKWHRDGLPRYQWGKKIYYKETELNECLEKHRITNPQQRRRQYLNQKPKNQINYDTNQ